MAIKIGAMPENDFHRPLGLLSDCHRRIERFLGALVRVTEQAHGGSLDEQERQGLDVALRYFRSAAPLHTADEEESLFPRLRELDDERVRQALRTMDSLEADHRGAEYAHAEVDRLGNRWLQAGTLPQADVARLAQVLEDLRETYRGHIAVEDTELFPLAGEVLPPGEVEAVGREMAGRRGVDFDGPPGLSRCASRRADREARA